MSRENIKNLAEFFRKAKENNEAFHIFIGAGCSVSAGIPAAKGLVRRINEEFKHVLDLKKVPEDEREDYMACMGALNLNQRQKLIKEYVDKSKINWANIVLAQLIKEGFVSRVLSFNFDNVLSKSCSLQGIYPAIYDFTVSNPNLHELIVDPAIVHLHGQSDGFNQLHDKIQTGSNAEKLNSFVSSTFTNSSCVFMGYSGEADEFFDVIAEQYEDRHDLFWMYRNDSFPFSVQKKLIDKSSNAHLIEWDDADLFLINLAQELEIFPPPFLANPYNHLLCELQKLADFPKDANSTRELFVETKVKLEQDSQAHEKTKSDDYDQLFLSGDSEKIIEKLKDKFSRTDVDNKALADAHFSIGSKQFHKAEENENKDMKKGLFEKARDNYLEALSLKPNMHEALNNLGFTLNNIALLTDSNDEAMKLLTQACENLQRSSENGSNFYGVFYNWGIALSNMAVRTADGASALVLFNKAIGKFQKALLIKPDHIGVLTYWGLALYYIAKQTEEPNKAVETLNQACDKYQQAVVIKPDFFKAYFNWCNSLLSLVQLSSEEDKQQYINKAFDVSKKAEALNQDQVYNLACLYAITEDFDSAEKYLLHCEKVETLPPEQHLQDDKDLDNLRGLDWFKALLKRMENPATEQEHSKTEALTEEEA